MKLNQAINLFAALGVFVSSTTMAAESPWQLSLGLGTASTSDGLDRTGLSNVNVDKSDVSVSFEIGYRFTDKLNFNFGYVDLGEADAEFTVQSTASGLPAVLDLNSDEVPILGGGVRFGVDYQLLTYQDIEFRGNLGLYIWESDYTSVAQGNVIRGEKDGSDIAYGISAHYPFNKEVSGFFKVNRYQIDQAVNELQLGVTYQF